MRVTSVRLSPEVEEKLATVAERARRSKSWLINEAVKRRWAETVDALASVRAGRIVGGDEVMDWIASWGKKAEKKPPR